MYRSFVGLEIHVQLATNTKVFCGCRASFGDEPNTNVCPVCMGYPGVLPALNDEAITMAYRVARALHCTLAPRTMFERKSYFYPDLPKNYQISQFASPVGTDGWIDLEFHKKKKRIRIQECHLEEDAGKMVHAGEMSLLDYNRAGTPLLEIVTAPDLEIGDEAEILLRQFRRMVRYLGVCDGNMEEGSLRCDANVSVNVSESGLGSKVEIKNLNSSRFVRKALNFEISRQEAILTRGGTVVQETRLWNENRDVSEPMRTKESAHDYRYFPEPDLPPFVPTPEFLEMIESSTIELPVDRKDRLIREYGLPDTPADVICDERSTADFFEEAVQLGSDPVVAATWLTSDVRKLLNRDGVELVSSPLSPVRFAELLMLLAEKKIHGKIAKQTLEAVFSEDKDPLAVIREKGWEQITDSARIASIVDEILAEHPQAVEDVRSGNTKTLGFLVGQVMKATSGRAEPQIVHDILKEKLSLEIIHVLSFGGAISGRRRSDGLVVPGELVDVRAVIESDPDISNSVQIEEIQLGRFLSEEITPADWASLIDAVAGRAHDAAGIVIAHGTDTLAYTASLLYWLFGDTSVPIVLTAAAAPAVLEDAESEPIRNLRDAVRKAASREPGVSVVYSGEAFAPVNLRFERFGGPTGHFRTWNSGVAPVPAAYGAFGHRELDRSGLVQRIEAAIRETFIVKVFPGIRGDSLLALMETGIRNFILELFDTGTANLRETPFGLRNALRVGVESGVRFFCTSQQEGIVDLSEYVTGHELWREGAIPMGELTTESVYTRLIAARLFSDTDDEFERMMEGD